MVATPQIPTPDKVMELVSKHVNASLALVQSQLKEVSATLGLPSPPALPAFQLPKGFPELPKLPGLPTPGGEKYREAAPPEEKPEVIETYRRLG